MSEYICTWLRSEHGDYLPLGCFCRVGQPFLALEELVEYGKFKWITRSNLHEMMDTCDTYIENIKSKIEEDRASIEFLNKTNGTVEELLDYRQDYLDRIKEYEEEILGWKQSKKIFEVYLDILDEASDSKFYSELPQYNEDYYILAGYETEYPNDDIVPDFPDKDKFIKEMKERAKKLGDPTKPNCDPDGFRKDFAKMINEFAGEEVLDVKPEPFLTGTMTEGTIQNNDYVTTSYSQWDPDVMTTTAQMNPEEVKKWDRAYEDAGFTFTKGE